MCVCVCERERERERERRGENVIERKEGFLSFFLTSPLFLLFSSPQTSFPSQQAKAVKTKSIHAKKTKGSADESGEALAAAPMKVKKTKPAKAPKTKSVSSEAGSEAGAAPMKTKAIKTKSAHAKKGGKGDGEAALAGEAAAKPMKVRSSRE